jgi:hypothetical protein
MVGYWFLAPVIGLLRRHPGRAPDRARLRLLWTGAALAGALVAMVCCC